MLHATNGCFHPSTPTHSPRHTQFSIFRRRAALLCHNFIEAWRWGERLKAALFVFVAYKCQWYIIMRWENIFAWCRDSVDLLNQNCIFMCFFWRPTIAIARAIKPISFGPFGIGRFNGFWWVKAGFYGDLMTWERIKGRLIVKRQCDGKIKKNFLFFQQWWKVFKSYKFSKHNDEIQDVSRFKTWFQTNRSELKFLFHPEEIHKLHYLTSRKPHKFQPGYISKI